jgi:hypothetical protein
MATELWQTYVNRELRWLRAEVERQAIEIEALGNTVVIDRLTKSPPAQGIEAASADKTENTGLAEGESPVGETDAP